MTNRVGQQFGNYRLTRLLGDGGFAEVYLGEHKELGTQVAIKVLKASLSASEVQNFRTEATTIAKLIHPHIVRVFDFGIRGNTPFMVMDYAPNGTLEQQHPTGTLVPLNTIVSYVKQVAEALQYAHDAKIIHRDVKPGNMLIGQRNEILLSDFGIAVIAHSTHSMIMQDKVGTLAYMAPEQLQGQPVLASDQYALGIVVYAWLCGEVPFNGTVLEMLTQHLFVAPPTLRAKVPTIAATVEQVVLKALAKDPKQRYLSVQKFAEALEKAGETIQVTLQATTVPPSQQPLHPTIPAVPQNSFRQLHDLNFLYREGLKAQAQGDLERAASLWKQILDQVPDYGNGTLISQMNKLLAELHPIRVQRFRQQAEKAHHTGKWQQEISAWTMLLRLEPQDNQARERIQVAHHNQRYAWMYENAQQFADEGDFPAAKKQLETLWHDAPYYCDPAGLAKKVRLRVPPSYEKVKAKGQIKGQIIEGLVSLVTVWFDDEPPNNKPKRK